MNSRDIMDDICYDIESIYNQDNMPEYYVVKEINDFDVVFWECGAIAVLDKTIYLLMEDDGHWFPTEDFNFSIFWFPSFVKAVNVIFEHLKINWNNYHYIRNKVFTYDLKDILIKEGWTVLGEMPDKNMIRVQCIETAPGLYE